VGDFLIATKGGLPSYQLAVVVDDARQGIDQIVRGDDLLTSTPRQILLYRALDLGPPPNYLHLPLVKGPDGKRLAKRHGDTRIAHYRELGVAPERIIGLMAEWCGIGPRREISSKEFAERLELEKMPREAVVFEAEDDAWLMEQL
jgi:glutamyl-tRNA synthetase